MELQQLRYFQEVAEQQHVTRAAEKLFVSQSAVSRAISQLEEELGVPLFHRQGRSVVLSKFGSSYLTFVRQALKILESASRSLHEGTSAETGTVAFGFIGSLGAELVPRMVEAFRKTWPKVQFTLIQRSGEALIEQLLHGNIDLCFSVPGAFDNPALRWTKLLDEPLVLGISRRHPLADRTSISLKELEKECFLALSPGRTLRTVFDEACADAGFVPTIAFEAMDLTTLRGMAAAGLGIAITPPSSSRFKGLVEISMRRPQLVRSIGMAWVEDRYMAPCSVNFRSFAEAFCQSQGEAGLHPAERRRGSERRPRRSRA